MIDNNEPRDILSNSIQRFAVSGLSKERKDEAVNEEILLGKYTGEFFIKSKDGVIISTDILNRLKTSTDTAIRFAETNGMTGSIYRLEFDNLILPSHIDYSTNIIGSEVINLPTETKRMLLNIDFDEYDILNNEAKPVSTNALLTVKLTAYKSSGSTEVIVKKSIQSINQTVIDVNSGSSISDITKLEVSEIIIEKDSTVFNTNYTDRTIILHNIFISIDK